MASELLWAVTGGPNGIQAVAPPEDRLEALAIRAGHDGHFWCTTGANGCGGPSILNAGQLVRPVLPHVCPTRCSGGPQQGSRSAVSPPLTCGDVG